MMYAELMPISGKKVLKLLLKDGWIKVSQSGSVVKLKKGKDITIIPVHENKDIPNGTLRAIENKQG
jgi:predicted RNA binding protein YcfA (HicA-like mRNA interferase family)